MEPLEFAIPDTAPADPAAVAQAAPTPKIPEGIVKAQRLGLIYLDPQEGPTPTSWFNALMFFASVLDITLCLVADTAYAIGFAWLVSVTPAVKLFPQALLSAVPLWQLGAVVGFLAALARPKIGIGVFAPGLRGYTIGLLRRDA